jgi:hypothetical protein
LCATAKAIRPLTAPRRLSAHTTSIIASLALASCTTEGKRASRSDETSPAGTATTVVAPPQALTAGPDWRPDTLDWDRWPVDVSWLNDGERPAGKHGKLTVRGGRLTFEDGTIARFWGANVAARALFQASRAAVARQAKRIAALGYNLIRIHHHDSEWVRPNVFQQGPTTQRLDPTALEAIDWWIKCLKDEGVYVWLDLQVGRRFRAGDGVPGFAELGREGGDGRGFDYVNPRLEQLMQEFADQYLGHRSAFTGLAAKDDPAVAAILLTNEDDLTTHFGGRLLPSAHNPIHQGLFETAAAAFARAARLPLPESLRIWEPGPAKIVSNELEARFFRRGMEHLRGIGVTVPIATTSYWGNEDMSALPSLAVGDLVDVHSYGEPGALSANPRAAANFVAWIGAARIEGKPLAISEWNVEFPKRDRFTAPLYLASIAAIQGWDAPMIFDYAGQALVPPTTMPAAAVMFRRQDVHQARRTYRFAPSREALYYGRLSPASSRTLRTLVEQSRLVVALPDLPELTWDTAAPAGSPGDIVVTDVNRDFIPAGESKVRSDTGEVERDWNLGMQTIDTPRSQAAAGRIGGHPVRLRDVELRIETPEATVALTSLDGQPLGSSEKILLTVVGPVAASAGDKPPFLAAPVAGSISLRSSRPALAMTPLSPRAYPTVPGPGDAGRGVTAAGQPITLERSAGRYTFSLPRGLPTHWFMIEPPRPTRGSTRRRAP